MTHKGSVTPVNTIPQDVLKPRLVNKRRKALRNAYGKGNATMMAQRFAKGLFKAS